MNQINELLAKIIEDACERQPGLREKIELEKLKKQLKQKI